MSLSSRLVLLLIVVLILSARHGEEIVGQLTVAERQTIKQKPRPAAPSNQTCGQADGAMTRAWQLTGPEWNGGDSAGSVKLPDGRQLWLFTDSFIGSIQTDNQRSAFTNTLVHNSMVTTVVGEPKTYRGTENGLPSAYFTPKQAGKTWYWPRGARVVGKNLYVFLGKHHETTLKKSAKKDIRQTGAAVATLALPSLKIRSITPLAYENIQWGTNFIKRGKYTYIYGRGVANHQHRAYLARVRGNNLGGAWQYARGKKWTRTHRKSRPIAKNIGKFSIMEHGKDIVMVTEQPKHPGAIVAFSARSVRGPFRHRRVLYQAPQPHGLYTYHPIVHPGAGGTKNITVSYNVTAANFDDVFADADNYRPRFVRIPKTCLPSASR